MKLRNKKKMDNLYHFYKNLFSNDVSLSKNSISSYSKDINLPKLSMKQRELWEGKLTKMEEKDALNKIENNKTPGNDDLTKDFFEVFWLKIKSPLRSSFKKGFLTEELSTSQKQAAIKLLEKKMEMKG